MFVPYGVDYGVFIDVEARRIAEHYGIGSPRPLIGDAPASDLVLEARDALAWRLVHERGLTLEAAAKLTRCDVDTVRAGVASHVTRLALHQRKTA